MRQRERSRLGPRLTAAAVGAVGIAAILAGALIGAEANVVPGHAKAVTHLASARHQHRYPAAATPEQHSEQPVRKAADSKHQAPPRKPATSARTPAAPPPAGQRPGTIRLPHGGTAELVRSEVTKDRTLPIPNGVHEATWWGAGLDAPHGATLFAGHVNWAGRTGPFNELWSDGKGDVVTVKDTAGKQYRYRISKVVTLHKNALPRQAADLFGQTGPHRVVLVTCGGRWVGGDDGYASNRIMVADPV